MTIKVTEETVTYGPDGNEIKSKSNEQESQDNNTIEDKLGNNQQNEGSVEKEIRDIQNNERRLIENMPGCQYTGDWNEKQRNEFLKTVNKLNEEQLMAPKENEINPQKSELQNQMGSAFTPQMQPSIPQPQYGDNTPI